jgi:prepilin-type N-terminal cleavage/methylation domain-containing protein
MSRKGFTLIELVMVIVIIGILAAVAIPKFISLKNDADRAVCQSNVGAIRTALSNFYAQCNINNSGCPNGTPCTSCFPDTGQMNFSASSPTLFGQNFFADGNLPDNRTTTTSSKTNWGAAYNVTTGTINMTACCP